MIYSDKVILTWGYFSKRVSWLEVASREEYPDNQKIKSQLDIPNIRDTLMIYDYRDWKVSW